MNVGMIPSLITLLMCGCADKGPVSDKQVEISSKEELAKSCSDEDRNEILSELESFAGTWEIVKLKPEASGQTLKKLVFNMDGTYAALDKDNETMWTGTFDLDPRVEPKRWDHRSDEAIKDGKDVLGIYELQGDTLRVLCVIGSWRDRQWSGKPRLKAFDPSAADVMIEMRRVESDAE